MFSLLMLHRPISPGRKKSFISTERLQSSRPGSHLQPRSPPPTHACARTAPGPARPRTAPPGRPHRPDPAPGSGTHSCGGPAAPGRSPHPTPGRAARRHPEQQPLGAALRPSLTSAPGGQREGERSGRWRRARRADVSPRLRPPAHVPPAVRIGLPGPARPGTPRGYGSAYRGPAQQRGMRSAHPPSPSPPQPPRRGEAPGTAADVGAVRDRSP